MGCWKWFNKALKEAGLIVTLDNKDQIDEVIHHFIGEKASYGKCSADWKKARNEIRDNEELMQELITRLQTYV